MELLFADDSALLAHTEEALQSLVGHFASAFGLTISQKKTEIMYQKPPQGNYRPPKINIDGHPLNAVDQLINLSSIISNNVLITQGHGLSKACSFLGCLQKCVWQNRSLCLKMKI